MSQGEESEQAKADESQQIVFRRRILPPSELRITYTEHARRKTVTAPWLKLRREEVELRRDEVSSS